MNQNKKIYDYKNSLTYELRNLTLCFLIKDNQVLLGMKKTGFGKGKYLGIGGKVEEGETIEQAAIREVQEEIGVVVKNIKKVGTLNFYFPFVEKPQKWNQKVHIFITENWEGEIIESEEMKPSWFNKKELPFDSMWSDAPYWTPLILDNKKIHAEFMFNKELEIIENIVLIN